MGTASLYTKDPATSLYLAGGLPEAYALFGTPLPVLPSPEIEHGKPVLLVRFHPHLRILVRRFLEGLLQEIEAQLGGIVASGTSKEQAEYEQVLVRILSSARAADRRMGLSNLFWLAHSRDVAECLRDIEGRTVKYRKLRGYLPPLLAPLYRRVEQAARNAAASADPERTAFLDGFLDNRSLTEALLDDAFAFTQGSLEGFNLGLFVGANKRHRFSGDLFWEIQGLLVREVERRLKERDRGLLARIERHLSGLPREQLQGQPGTAKVALNSEVMTYLLADPWSTGSRLMALPKVKAETEKRSPAEIIEAFLDLAAGLKRFELICHLRDHVRRGQGIAAEEELDRKVREGMRVYDFGQSAQVLNNAVNATVLFLDLRGFTQTSEGHVSEGGLTRELYTIFDAFTPLVARFGGTVDKFLGDGMMVTFGTEHADPMGPMNAVRTAVLCQEALDLLRREKRSRFHMGVSIHYGRVYVARFIADEQQVQVTVIGRNVNLAGRLSSASKKPPKDDSPRALGLRVSVDQDGILFNEGIAISRAALVQLESQVSLSERHEGDARLLEYFDEAIGRRILVRYAGDAKFKGVPVSFPVFEVDHES